MQCQSTHLRPKSVKGARRAAVSSGRSRGCRYTEHEELRPGVLPASRLPRPARAARRHDARPDGRADITLDPSLVGTWETSGTGPNGAWRTEWRIDADGKYELGGALVDRGSMQAADGRWTLRSDVTALPSSGTYTIVGRTAITATGALQRSGMAARRSSIGGFGRRAGQADVARGPAQAARRGLRRPARHAGRQARSDPRGFRAGSERLRRAHEARVAHRRRAGSGGGLRRALEAPRALPGGFRNRRRVGPGRALLERAPDPTHRGCGARLRARRRAVAGRARRSVDLSSAIWRTPTC